MVAVVVDAVVVEVVVVEEEAAEVAAVDFQADEDEEDSLLAVGAEAGEAFLLVAEAEDEADIKGFFLLLLFNIHKFAVLLCYQVSS